MTPLEPRDLSPEEQDALVAGLDQLLDPEAGQVIVA
jgi:hypothetical protein